MTVPIRKSAYYAGAIFAIAVFVYVGTVRAATLDELKQLVGQKNKEVQTLEDNSKKARQGLASNQQIGKTLKEEVTRLGNNITRLTGDIMLTQKKIERTELEIQALTLEIADKEERISRLRDGLGSLMRILIRGEQSSFLELFLSGKTFSDVFHSFAIGDILQKRMLTQLGTLHTLEANLRDKEQQATQKRNEAHDFKDLLTQRQTALASQRKEQSFLLAVTKQQEASYQALIQEQTKRKLSLEQEIRKIEEQIRITIDPSLLPKKGRGTLGWPLADLSLSSCWSSLAAAKNCVTQFFGYTDFAAVGAYAGKGHNGVDFRADIGGSVLSAEEGVVEGTGDTDEGCRGASYGKWILIRHTNNLSTLYGHLSSITVSPGQRVSRGMRIAFGGKTGYATGPHLHFGVYATQGVRIQQIRSAVCGRMMTLPIAAINAYINPLDYL